MSKRSRSKEGGDYDGKKLEAAQEEFIIAIYFYERHNSPPCWNSIEKANLEYQQIKSNSEKLRAVKEQILIRYLGLGWVDAHHPWSRAGRTFTPDKLFDHLVGVIIPLASKLDVPAKPPTSLPAPPDLPVLGTKANIDLTKGSHYASRIQGVAKNAYNKRDVRESEGNGDKLLEMQEFNVPEINSAFVGFNIEKSFELSDIEGG